MAPKKLGKPCGGGFVSSDVCRHADTGVNKYGKAFNKNKVSFLGPRFVSRLSSKQQQQQISRTATQPHVTSVGRSRKKEESTAERG